MSKNDVLSGVLILLIVFASSHSFFGKNLPRFVWVLSIVGSALTGIVFGLLLTDEFPANIFCGTAVAISIVCLTLILRQTRKRHER